MSPPARARLFVALDLPAQVRARLAGWAAAHAADMPDVRPLEESSLHVTLCFLGDRAESEAPALGAVVTDCARPVRGLGLSDARWLPARRPRVLAVALDDGGGELAALQRAVAEALVREAAFEPESRSFLPHVTVARVGRRASRHPIRPPALAVAPAERAPARFDAAALTLYRSHLGRGGARYEPLARAGL